MKVNVCCVKDVKLGLYDKPFNVRMVGEAIREWEIIIKDSSTKFGKSPGDFELHQIATWDDESGEFVQCKPIIQLG